MVIKVIGMGCENCDKLYENVMEAVKETGSDAVVEKVGDLMEIVKLGVMAAPSLMAMPTFAADSAGESLMPSPIMMPVRPALRSASTKLALSSGRTSAR